MFRLLHRKVFLTVLVYVCLTACTATEVEIVPNSEQPIVAFDFTPVPTSTKSSTPEEEPTEFAMEAYSVQMDNAVTTIEESTAEEESSADTGLALESQTVGEREETPQTSKRIDLVDRETLVNNIISSRNIISNLTYTINVASGVGTLSCLEVVNYYGQLLEFEQYNVSPGLHIANESYSHALNASIVGVQYLYDFCVSFLAESAYNDEILVREITPEEIWKHAVAESNVGIRAAENAVGWLKGEPRVLSGVYDQVQIDLDIYAEVLGDPSLDACSDIRSAFKRLVLEAMVLDLGSETISASYVSYRLAVDSINETGIGLYEFCDVNMGGAGQMAEDHSHLLPEGLIETALIGHQQARSQLEMAYFYMTSPVFPSTAESEEPAAEAEAEAEAEADQNGATQTATDTGQAVWTSSDETVLAINVFVVSIQQSSQPHLWEIVVGIEPNGGTAPYTLLSAGTLHENNTITIVQTCDRNFRDTISVRDAAGLLFRSEKLEVQRSGVCGL